MPRKPHRNWPPGKSKRNGDGGIRIYAGHPSNTHKERISEHRPFIYFSKYFSKLQLSPIIYSLFLSGHDVIGAFILSGILILFSRKKCVHIFSPSIFCEQYPRYVSQKVLSKSIIRLVVHTKILIVFSHFLQPILHRIRDCVICYVFLFSNSAVRKFIKKMIHNALPLS